MARDRGPIFLKKGRSSSAPQVEAYSVIFGDEGQHLFLKHSSFHLPGSPAKRRIKRLAGTHYGGHRREEWQRHFPGLAIQLIVVPDSVYRETSGFSPRDNR